MTKREKEQTISLKEYKKKSKEEREMISVRTSEGMIEKRKSQNLVFTARTLMEQANILPMLIDNIRQEVEEGYNKNALELFRLIKEPEAQQIDVKAAVAGIQKIYVSKKEESEVLNHIKEVIE